jgi:hypothetical protein
MKTFLLAAVAAFTLAAGAQAQPLGLTDLPDIKATATNDIKFGRTFAHKHFSASVTFSDAGVAPSTPRGDGYLVSFNSSGVRSDLVCFVRSSDKQTLDLVADLKQGDPVALTGTLHHLSASFVYLTECEFGPR